VAKEKERHRARASIRFWATAILVLVIYFLIPNFRLPARTTSFIQWGFAWIAVVYLVLGFLGVYGRREGFLFTACRSFLAMAGALFLLFYFLNFSSFLVTPLYLEVLPDSKAPVAVVLGAGIHSDGEPTLTSRWRVIRSVQLYNEGRVPLLLFTAGIANGEKTEAGVMARYARSLGVPEKAILLEERSTNTEENAQFASKMLRALSIGEILLVTDPLHMRRAVDSFRIYGIRAMPAPTFDRHRYELSVDGWDLLVRGLHEYIGIAYYRLRWFLRNSPG
jgi:uncharacterized SAM-binding protein YcdF (DUF218 family)